MRLIYLKVVRFFIYIYFITRLCKLKHLFLRYVVEGRQPKQEVPLRPDLETLTIDTFAMQWHADDWRRAFDLISTPETAQARISAEPGGFLGDCDEFAITHVARIEKGMKAGEVYKFQGKTVISTSFTTVLWLNGYKFDGHNIALICVRDDATNTLQYSYIDYDLDSPLMSNVRDVITYVTTRYSKDNAGTLILACLQDLKLTPFACIV